MLRRPRTGVLSCSLIQEVEDSSHVFVVVGVADAWRIVLEGVER